MPFCEDRVECDNFLPMKGGECYANKCFKRTPQAPNNQNVGVSNSTDLLCAACGVKEVLGDLLALKQHKDEYGKDDFYMQTHPKLWRKAKELLGA